MFKNVASQSVTLYAVDASTGLPKIGDAANMVFYLSKDDGAVTAIAASAGVPTESDNTNAKGDYKIALSQSETNADKLRFSGKSSTSNIVVAPQTIYTAPANFTALAINGGNVTVGTNTDKTGYQLTVAPLTSLGSVSPANWITTGSFAPGAINPTVAPNLDAAVSSRSTFAGGPVASVTAPVTVGSNTDKTGYTVSTVTDKTGYSLTQAFPSNFGAMSITSGGNVAMDGSKSPTVRNQDAVSAPTYDDCLVGAWVEAFGKEPTFNSSVWVKQLPSNGGPIRTFVITVDGSGNVSARN